MSLRKTIAKIVHREKKNNKAESVQNKSIRILEDARRKAGKDFLFSVILPFYNTGKYLAEAIESVVNQTIGIEYIQIILVNDGSTDESAEIAKGYQSRFPKNIVYIEQEQAGASAARNRGLEMASGLYINFLDSDDKWSKNAFNDTVHFLNEFGVQDLLAAKIRFFDRMKGNHKRNYIFKRDQIISIDNEYESAMLAAPQSFIKYSLIGDTRYCEEMNYAEDARFMMEIMMKTESFGAMKTPIYYYRRRFESNSLTDTANKQSPDYYYDKLLAQYHEFIIQKAKEEVGSVPKFVQATLAYDLGFRIGRSTTADDLNPEELDKYRERLIGILSEIDDDVIKTGRVFFLHNKVYMLALKHRAEYNTLIRTLQYKDGNIVCQINGKEIAVDYLDNPKFKRIRIEFINVDQEKQEVVVEGTISYASIPSELMKVKVVSNEKDYIASIYPRKHKTGNFPLDDIGIYQLHFRCVVPLENEMNLSLFASIAGSPFMEQKQIFGRYALLNEKCPDSSYAIREEVLFYLKEGHLCLKKIPKDFDRSELEEKYINDIKKKKNSEKWVKYRRMANDKGKESNKIWLLFDRITSAEDSAEEVFRYLKEHPVENVTPAFVIREDVPDFERLKQFGKVIPFGSDEHKWATLHADKYISASGEARYYFPFEGEDYKYLNDLLTSDFVFVEHGVIKDDISGWLHRANCNIKLFVATAERERQAILDDPYGYDENTVVLTGIPRFDKFDRDTGVYQEKVIYVMPTWRKWLASFVNAKADDSNDIRQSKDEFTASEYFKFYDGLLRSERMHELLDKYDYELFFALHPAMGVEAEKFYRGGRVHVLQPESFSYGDAFKRMSLLITDYSSVAFNQAFLRKPIIYAQFDFDDFYCRGKHIGDAGYFSFENDGFGAVKKDLESVIDQVNTYLENGCVMEDIYKKRANEFFFTPPEGVSRSELIVKRILEL